MKRIKESAILYEGNVYTGKRHQNVIDKIMNSTGVRHIVGELHGFITECGEFVNREQAAIIALERGQIEKLKYHTTELFSEDLY